MIYYAVLSQEKTGLDHIWPIASLVVFVSILVHGISAIPLTRLLGRATTKQEGDEDDAGDQIPPDGVLSGGQASIASG